MSHDLRRRTYYKNESQLVGWDDNPSVSDAELV